MKNIFGTFLGVMLLFAPTTSYGDAVCPQCVVDSNLENYSQEEANLILEDLKNIRKLTFNSTNPQEKPVYVGTAGGPGAAKSTILEGFLMENPLDNKAAYVDPDRVSLRSMIHTYIPHLSAYNASKRESYGQLSQEAYRKWRGGSNYIALTMLNESASQKVNIAHGTTATSPHIGKLYQNLKEKGYEIVLLLCGSTDQNRGDLIEHRQISQAITQVEPSDIITKGKDFPQRFQTYFDFANKIYIYWTENLEVGSVLAATYSPAKGLEVQNKGAFERFTGLSDSLCK